jgi:TrmH family RNA methyltransferase
MFGPKVLAKLQQKKYRQEYGCFVVEGKKGVLDAVKAGAQVQQLVVTDLFIREQQEYCHQSEIQEFFSRSKVLELPEDLFARVVESSTPQGVAAVVTQPEISLQDLLVGKRIAILEDIRDPGNLGTMIRTADWFGVDGLVLIGGADPYQPKVVRSSMGSLFHLPIVISENTKADLQALKSAGFSIVVTRPEVETSLTSAQEKIAVVFGNEAEGTSALLDSLADAAFSIPKFGQAESLNVAVSFGIVMHELQKLK